MAELLIRDGGRIAYDDSGGDGPLVVCVPGAGDLRTTYRFLTPHLQAAGYRVVTTDLRGLGDSSAGWPSYTPRDTGEDLLSLLTHLDAGPAALITNSFSPASAIWAAAEAPHLISGVVLGNTWIDDPKLNPVVKLLAQVVLRSPRAWVRFHRSRYPTAPPADLPEYLATMRANLAQPGRMAAVRAMMFAPKGQCNSRLGELTCPVLVLMGAADPDFKDPHAQARLIADRARTATIAMIDQAGHYPAAEFPEATAEALLPFLAQVTAGHRAK